MVVKDWQRAFNQPIFNIAVLMDSLLLLMKISYLLSFSSNNRRVVVVDSGDIPGNRKNVEGKASDAGSCERARGWYYCPFLTVKRKSGL